MAASQILVGQLVEIVKQQHHGVVLQQPVQVRYCLLVAHVQHGSTLVHDMAQRKVDLPADTAVVTKDAAGQEQLVP